MHYRQKMIMMVCLGIGLLVFGSVSKAETETDNSSRLLDLARKKFGTLTPAEETLFGAVANGSVAYYSSETPEDNDLSKAESWPAERCLPSDRIAWLCSDEQAKALVTHQGITIIGARIDNLFELRFIKIPFLLLFVESVIPEGINLISVEMQMLSLVSTHTGPIHANGLNVEKSIFMRDGFRAEGGVNLCSATIGERLDCSGGEFINSDPNGYAINANSLKVEDNVFLRSGFRVEGGVDLRSATLGGQLDCSGGKFINPDGDAICADSLEIKENVFLCDGFRVEGGVNLRCSTLGGQLDCSGGKFINPGGNAIDAGGLKIEGSVLLGNGFRAEGEVDLHGVTIDGQLNCIKGEFINPDGDAICADSLNVEKSVLMRDGFRAEGQVNLAVAKIGEAFVWKGVDCPEETWLDLRYTTVGMLSIERGSWPKSGCLALEGLTYRGLYNESPQHAKTHIEWIRRQYDKETSSFCPQPYEQLAEVLLKKGHENDAKHVLIAKNKDRVEWGPKLTVSEWWWYQVFGPLIDYGYRPLKALWWIAGFIVLGWRLFWKGQRKDFMKPMREKDDLSFNSLVYSIDTFVPLVDLHQAKYWLPKHRWLRFYHWLHIFAGWILMTLFVGGLAGLIKS